MLLQSHAGEIHLLPALPAAWPEGEFRGFRARGGVEVDVTWANGRATSVALRPQVAGTHRLRVGRGQRVASIRANGTDVAFKSVAGAAVVTMRAGVVYQVQVE